MILLRRILPLLMVAGLSSGQVYLAGNRDIPAITDVIINDGDLTTESRVVSIAIAALDDPTEMILSEDPAFGDAVWLPFSSPSLFTLSEGAGLKTVYAMIRNTGGVSEPDNDDIELIVVPDPVNDLCIKVDSTNTNVYLTWSPVLDALSYAIYADTIPDFALNPNTFVSRTSVASFVDPVSLPLYQSMYYTIMCESQIPVEEGMVWIPPGWFTMGSSQAGATAPEHQVYLDGYYIDIYEVTNAQFRAYCDSTGYPYLPPPDFEDDSLIIDYFINYPDYPLVGVRWSEACAYCEWLGKRLPTEAEWERAAKGNEDNRLWPWGNTFYQEISGTIYHANIQGEADGWLYTSPVGSYPTGISPTGCYDMAGNVNDHCWDWYADDYYSMSPDSNPQGPETGTAHVRRGGAWHYYSSLAKCSSRYWLLNGLRGSCSFRCVKTP